MRIGILGSGDAGQALGTGLAARGHDVIVATRDPAAGKLDAWQDAVGPAGRVGTFPEAAAHGELVVLATLGEAVLEAVERAGRDNLAGKIVVDATNPLDFEAGPAPGLLHSLDDSNGERVQRAVPSARVVKAFNTVPNARMADPQLEGARMLICGDDGEAKARVEELLIDLGWDGALDVGGVEESRWLEALVPLWVRAGAALGRWDHVFDVRY